MEPLDVLFRSIEVGITAALIFYAYATIKEARNDRRKNTIERMLENLYSPLREILTRARFENNRRTYVRQQPCKEGPRDYVFEAEEFEQIRRMIENFGYYLEPVELLKLRKDFQNYDIITLPYGPDKEPSRVYRFHNNTLDPRREHIEKKCESLIKELQKLTGASKT